MKMRKESNYQPTSEQIKSFYEENVEKFNVCSDEQATSLCPFHEDKKSSFSMNLKTGQFMCHALSCGAQGNIIIFADDMEIPRKELPGWKSSKATTDHNQIETIYPYLDEKGQLLFEVVRYRSKDFRCRKPDGKGGYTPDLKGVRRVLYRFPELLSHPSETVFIVEGEKDVDNLRAAGFCATSNPHGAGKWREEYSEALKDRDVVIIPDNDVSGEEHCCVVVKSLWGKAKSIKILRLPDLLEKGDVSDWLKNGGSPDKLRQLAASANQWQPKTEKEPDAVEEDGDEGNDVAERESQATKLVRLVLSQDIELFHDEIQKPYARFKQGNHYEIRPIGSEVFKQWVTKLNWDTFGKCVSSDIVKTALETLKAKALYEGKPYTLFNRVAWCDGAIWIDLADDLWRAIRVGKDGWKMVDNPPILFKRNNHQAPQVEPLPGGNLTAIFDLLNLTSNEDRQLFIVSLVASLIPGIPHPIDVVYGDKGSAKSTLLKVKRRLVDPSQVELGSFPKSSKDLPQYLDHNWYPIFDNVGALSDEQSDMLCRAVTGEGIVKRELYTDDGDIIFRYKRSIGLSGINLVAHQPDLLDRTLLFKLQRIPNDKYMDEGTFETKFAQIRRQVLGGLLDLLSKAMTLEPGIKTTSLFRMADFTRWGCATFVALGYSADEFLTAYGNKVGIQNDEAIQSSYPAQIIIELMKQRSQWEGTPTELYNEACQIAARLGIDTKDRAWSKGANSFSRRLNLVKSNLTAVGITIEQNQSGDRAYRITKTAPAPKDTAQTAESPSLHTNPDNTNSEKADIKSQSNKNGRYGDIGGISNGSLHGDAKDSTSDKKKEAESPQKLPPIFPPEFDIEPQGKNGFVEADCSPY